MSTGNQTCSVPAESRAFLNKLKALDLEPIAFKLMHPVVGQGWTRSQTIQAIAHYLMFLYIVYLYPQYEIVPTLEIDRVWHYHLLDTSKYAQDCQMLFGRFLHHFPYLGLRGEADREHLQMAFAQTQELFRKHFGAHALGEGELQQAADCEPLGCATLQYRPRADIDMAEAGQIFLSTWLD
jgi:hypothetical protein